MVGGALLYLRSISVALDAVIPSVLLLIVLYLIVSDFMLGYLCGCSGSPLVENIIIEHHNIYD